MTDGCDNAVLGALFDAAQAACERDVDTHVFEPAFVALLDFIKRNPACRDAAEKRFLTGLSERTLCHELIGFCMHTLRWHAVKDMASALIDPASPRGWGPLSEIVASFDEDWDARDLYDYYKTGADRP